VSHPFALSVFPVFPALSAFSALCHCHLQYQIGEKPAFVRHSGVLESLVGGAGISYSASDPWQGPLRGQPCPPGCFLFISEQTKRPVPEQHLEDRRLERAATETLVVEGACNAQADERSAQLHHQLHPRYAGLSQHWQEQAHGTSRVAVQHSLTPVPLGLAVPDADQLSDSISSKRFPRWE
jgi:hypothetical protein